MRLHRRWVLAVLLNAVFALHAQTGSRAVPADTGSRTPRAQAQEALDIHNQARRDVGVGPLEWSADLSRYAQQWADSLVASGGCGLKHRDAGAYGENLAGGSGPLTALGASRMWHSEKKGYVLAPVSDANWYKTGHYTQMVWKDTRLLGMGQADCRGGGTIVVANYDPAGNVMGQSPYAAGGAPPQAGSPGRSDRSGN